jgi:hypothetical protein
MAKNIKYCGDSNMGIVDNEIFEENLASPAFKKDQVPFSL